MRYAATQFFHLEIAELVVLLGVLLYIATSISDRFVGRPALERLRTENDDLMRINSQLEKDVATLRSQVAVLESQVRDLKRHDQQHVLASLAHHEEEASARHERTIQVLGEIRDKMPSPEEEA